MPEIIKNSVSQMQNAKGCMRRWWGRSVQHWPQIKAAATIYGDVLHAVCDRYMNATDQGLDIATGKLMDLYPTNWYKMKNRWDKTETIYEINIVEQAQIKLLIQTAIENGILLREPGRIAEDPFTMHVTVPGFEGYIVEVNGFKDLVLPDGVFDYKSTKKSGHPYTKSINGLKEDIQMMVYGLDHILRHTNLIEVRLGHNQFIKDRINPRVMQKVAKVTPAHLFDFFNQIILPLMYDMLLYRLKYPKGTDSYFNNVPMARDTKECNFYYGKPCPYLNICTNVCTPTKYCESFKIKENRNIKPPLGEQIMPTKLMAAIAAEQGGVVPPSSAPAPIQQSSAPLIPPANPPAPPAGGAPPQVALLTAAPTASGQVIPAFTAPVQPQATMAGPLPIGPTVQDQPQMPGPIPVQSQQIPSPIPTQSQQIPGPIPAQIPGPIPGTAPGPIPAPIQASFDTQQPSITALPTEPPVISEVAPWFSPDCEVCRTSKSYGFRADGQPCQICQIKSGAAAQPSTANPDGSVTYAQPGQEFQSTPLPAAVVQVQEQAVVTPVAAVSGTPQIQPGIPGMPEHPYIANPPTPITSMVSPTAQASLATNIPQTTRPDLANALPAQSLDTGTHYTLLMGCVVASDRTTDQVYDAQDMYRQALDLVKQQSGQDLRTLDHFKALEIIDTLVPPAIAGISNAVISAHTGCKGSLYHRFVDGLRMYADRVIVACAE